MTVRVRRAGGRVVPVVSVSVSVSVVSGVFVRECV